VSVELASLAGVTTTESYRSLTRAEAVRRAELLEVESYDVRLELDESETFRSTTTVRFGCGEPGASTFVELADPLSLTVTLNGRNIEGHEGNRIALDELKEDNELVVDALLRCTTSGDGMHRYVDPADGATYVSAYCGMDVAQRVFACFDQPDLRATITLTVEAPAEWTVLANGRPVSTEATTRSFATTPAIPPYLFVVCAGPWHSRTWEGPDGVPFGWHARRSLAADLDASIDELQQVTEACYEHYTSVFDEPFAFDSYDQAMVPGLNWGAMEMPGCVTFRDELLSRSLTDGQRQLRAMVIAHEMAHMWFGDLVTMRWWEDAWLSESFADFMGFEVASKAAGFGDAWTGFTLQMKPGGYAADERRSTHPVAPGPESVVDVDTAFGNFDRISYAKGNSVLRQLVTWLGEETFLRGANAYLTRHRLGNAELDDFLDALDGVTDREVRPWADVWLRATGFDTLRVRREAAVPVIERDGIRPHRTMVSAYTPELVLRESRMLDLADDPVRIPEWEGLVVLPNSHDHTFARIRPDLESWHALATRVSDLEDAASRAVVWATAFDLVRCAELDPAELVTMVVDQLPAETHPAIWEAVLDRALTQVLVRHVPTAAVSTARADLADTCAATSTPHLALAAARGLAATTSDVELLEGWLSAGHTRTGVEVDTNFRWRVLRRLAELGATDTDRIAEQLAADPSTQAEMGAARARAALPHPESKREAWERMASPEVSNRIFQATAEGLWVAEQADLVAPYVTRYLAEAPDWARDRGQGFGLEVGAAFPRHAVDLATESALREALADDVPTVLRRVWDDALDDLAADLTVRRRWV